MPLVTRQTNQGNVFNQDTEPPNWLDGDLWSDIGQNPPILKLNDAGTARPCMWSGILAAGDIPTATGANVMGRLTLGTSLQVLRANVGATATEYGDLTELWTVLGDYEATSAEASHNFNFTAVDFNDDSYLVLIIDASSSAALELRLRVNTNATANYFTDGRLIKGGVETFEDLLTETSIQLGSTTFYSAANDSGFHVVEIGLTKAGTNDRPYINSQGYSANGSNEQMCGLLNVNISSITDIDVITSTSTWQIGTRMTLYKVARA